MPLDRKPTRLRRSLVLALTVAVFGLGGCAGRIDTRGNLPDEERLAEVQPGDMTREEVAEILGSPSSVTPFKSDAWFYISERTKTVAFLAPEVVKREVVMIQFDGKGVVSNVKKLDLSDGKDIEQVKRVTPTSGNEITVMEQLFLNLGRFNAPTATQ